MSPRKEPVYYVLKNRIPSTQDWLGSIVQFYQDPTASYIPLPLNDQTFPSTKSTILTSTETDFHLNLQVTKDKAITSRLSQLLNLGNSTSKSDSLNLHTSCITYRRLTNHRHIFDRLITQPNMVKDLMEIVPFGHKAYMVVGLVQIEPASSVQRSKETSTTTEHGFSLPVTEAATAAAGMPISLGGIGDVEMERRKSSSFYAESNGSSGDTCEIIAFEYSLIRRNMRGLGRKLVFRESVVEFKGGLTFGSGKDKSSDEESPENTDDDGNETGELEVDDTETGAFEDLFIKSATAGR
ncbi:MAG: hypothetical protein Q9219_004966 [cf. Caloplaca sp. 3 TL-2023]